MVGRNSEVGGGRHDHSHTNTRHSSHNNVKTRHSTGGIVKNTGASSRLRTGTAVKSTLTTRKRYSDTRKLDSPEAELGDVVGKFKPSSPGVTTLLGASSGRRSSASSRNRSKNTSKGANTISKPISPNPSESSTATSISGGKTSCISPDLSVGGGSATKSSPQLEQMWPSLDTSGIQLENRHLKDLLVSQLDLIQQQSETILSREKQLKDLRMENEQLRQRLERMERRVRVTGESSGGGNDSAQPQVPSTNSDNPFNKNSNINKEASNPPTQPLTTQPSTNSRKRPFSATIAEQSQRRSSTPPVVPAKRIKRESGTYSIVSSPIAVSTRNISTPLVASSSSLLLPAKTSSPAPTKPSLLPSKQQLKSALTAAASSATKEDIQSSSSSTSNEFPRFDELTDEIFEESDDRFRISHEDSKSISSGVNSGSDKTILEKVTTLAGDKRRKSESVSVNGGLGGSTKNKQRVGQKQTEVQGGEEHQDSQEVPKQDALDPLSTPYHYHVGCVKELINKDDKLTECSLLHQLGVEVPNFRKDEEYDKKMGKINTSNKRNPYNKYKEDIEKLEDAAFLKRHDKPEQLEKKTKKWDIQRLREEQRLEKLRARQNQSGNKNKKQQPDTLLPSPEDARILMVCEDGHLPVSVFGESVPAFPQSSFCLPWVGKKSGKSEVSKRSRQNHPEKSSRSSKH